MVKDKNNILDSGFTRQQTEIALKKAQIGYDLSNKENNVEGKKHYAWIIYKLQRELRIRATPFREVKMLALQFFTKNPELFKQDEIKGEKVLKVMMESGYMPDKPIKMKKMN
jgi:hypothetical protein